MIRCVCKSRDSVLCVRALLLKEFSREFLIRVFCRVLLAELVEQEQKNVNRTEQKTRLETTKPPTYFTIAISTCKQFYVAQSNICYFPVIIRYSVSISVQP